MVKKQMDNLSTGDKDLTSRFSVTRKDQVQDILSSINTFLEQIHSTVKKINDSKIVLEDAAKNLNSKVLASNSDLSEIAKSMDVSSQAIDVQKNAISSTASAVTQISSNIDSLNKMIEGQASAITEASASIEEMVGNINSVTSSVESMAGEFEELSKATEVGTEKNNVVSSLLSRISETSVVLVNANDAIAAIAEQTNLLAMNAAIEAAHAGEAGKGFAVVADEISSLAANSRQTAATIQDIANEVTAAVNNLAKNAQEALDFINGTVIGDYNEYVDTGEKYGKTADVMNEMLTEFSEKADSLNEIMQAMVESVDTITNSVQESSLAINMSAENSTEIVTGIKKIFDAMDRNTEVTEQLNDTTQKFKSL
jgi:methyl-accepting chemotaxis protein